MKKNLVLCCFLACVVAKGADDAKAVRDVIRKRSAAYHNLDARALAALEAPDFQLVDRFGDNITSDGPEYNKRMWAWTFKEVYKGKPGPEHKIVGLRFLTADVAILQTGTQWPELKLDDGTVIPPHGELDTFTLVRRGGGWKIAMQTIHNQFGGIGDHPAFGNDDTPPLQTPTR